MVYTKVVDLNRIYIFGVDDFFISNYLETQIFMCKFSNFEIYFFYFQWPWMLIWSILNFVALNVIYTFCSSHIFICEETQIFQATSNINIDFTKVIDLNAVYIFVVHVFLRSFRESNIRFKFLIIKFKFFIFV
jgi:hypothetical protein